MCYLQYTGSCQCHSVMWPQQANMLSIVNEGESTTVNYIFVYKNQTASIFYGEYLKQVRAISTAYLWTRLLTTP